MEEDKKSRQLGMNPSTAQQRLVKDTLFRLAVETGHVCYRCGEPLIRETFSIEHKEAWLDSPDPKGLFFDQGNIAFSHSSCNSGAGRRARKYFTEEDRIQANNRLQREHNSRAYTKEKRRERYLLTGN